MTAPVTPRTVRRVLIVEDDPVMAAEAAAAVAIFPGAVIARAGSVAEAQRIIAAAGAPFDLAIVDLGLPDGSGTTIIRALMRDTSPSAEMHEIPTICVARTVFDDDANLFEALSAGSFGYLLKGEPLDSVQRRLRAAIDGEPVVSPGIARRVLAFFRGESPIQKALPGAGASNIAPAALTARETDVLRLLAKGYTVAESGKALSLSVNTIKTHIKNVYARLDVSSRIAAVDAARRMGILDDDMRR